MATSIPLPNPTINPGDLSAALTLIQRSAAVAAELKTVELKCDNGGGGEVKIPVAFVANGDGKVTKVSLLEELRAGSEFAVAQRLLTAAGPDRREGSAIHQSLDSFIHHTNRFKASYSAVWADQASRRLVSVLDYHPAGADSEALWGKHRGIYACPLSDPWIAWGGGEEMELDQDAFAALLDARDRELYAGKLWDGRQAPDPAALITLAANLEVYSSATAKRERDPSSGRVKLTFTEEKGVAGAVQPPPSFLVNIPVFVDSLPMPLEVRLRVTVEDGDARFHVRLHASGDVLRAAFTNLCKSVIEETDIPLFIGTPEA